MLASERGHTTIVQLLLEAGANVNEVDGVSGVVQLVVSLSESSYVLAVFYYVTLSHLFCFCYRMAGRR